MTPQLDGVYVPLAIVERQKPKPQPRNQQEQKEKETEKLIPIAEERFFEDVLRQGKSDISQGRKIAIIGEPGAGKTTRLQKIADWILEQDLGLPIWIDLAELGAQSICQYLEKVWLSRCQGEVTRGDLESQISRVWLLLDGVDEMTHTQGMQQLGKDLLRSWVQDSRVVVTCRVNVWEADKNAFSGFDVFRNLEFNAEQVTEYIRRWFAGMGDAATGENLELALAESENSRLKELIQNPLRLWMLCQIWSSRQGTLPDTQAKLYASFIKYIYRWKEQFIKIYAKLCGKTLSECQKLLHEALGELAKAAIDGKSGRFRLSYQLVSEYLGERSDETSLLSLALSLGWLNRVGIDFDEPVYAFYHATFQEYFAALAVDDWDYFLPRNHVDFPVVGKVYRIFEAQWKQVIVLWLGRGDIADEKKEEFIEALMNFEDNCNGFYYLQSFCLASVGIGEFQQCSRADEIVKTLIDNVFSYKIPDPCIWTASIALRETDRNRAIANLIALVAAANMLRSCAIKPGETMICLSYISQYHWILLDTLDYLVPYRIVDFCLDDDLDDINLEKITNDLINLLPDRRLDILLLITFTLKEIRDFFEVPRFFTFLGNDYYFLEFQLVVNILEQTPPEQICSVAVSTLKKLLTAQFKDQYLEQYQKCYDVLFYCVENLPYPTFYQAWHHQLTTPHPEVPETTGVGSTPFTQSLNLADLPNILDARLADTQLIESLQLICIDTSKFIDSHNPALEIYEQFLDKNCPQRPNGEPETLPQLKSYWNQLRRDSDKHPILIFYQDPTSPATPGLSPTFLDALTCFDGTICLITDTPHPPLQTFSPHDSDLVQTVVNWLKRVHLES